jgi:hypothetical protein
MMIVQNILIILILRLAYLPRVASAFSVMMSASSKIASLHRSVKCGDEHMVLKVVYDPDRVKEKSCEQLPVVLFLSGADCSADSYMWLASCLAKEGFCVLLSTCVVAFGQSTCLLSTPFNLSMLGTLSDYKRGPSSEGIAAILQELGSLAQQQDGPLCGKLDLSCIVLGGHSSGGRTSLDLVAYDSPFNISAVFTYGASLVNTGLSFTPKGSVLSCEASNPPPLLLLGGSEDGISARLSGSGDDATETLRRTMNEAFIHGNGDADLVILKGANHMVFCSPVDPSCGAVATDRSLACDGRLVRNVLGGIICDFLRSRGISNAAGAASSDFHPKVPALLLHTAESFRPENSPRPQMIVSDDNGSDNEEQKKVWELVSSALDGWIAKIVTELGLEQSDRLPVNAKSWTAGNLTGSLQGWESPLAAWAIRYNNTGEAVFMKSMGFNVWLAPHNDAPHLTIYVGVRGNSVTLMADHLARYDLIEHQEYAKKYYGGEKASFWSELRRRSGVRPFASLDPTVRAVQGPNALALMADIVTVDDSDGMNGISSLVEALDDHCENWLQFVRDASSSSLRKIEDEMESIAKRDLTVRRLLRDHERTAGQLFMDAELASFLANAMAGLSTLDDNSNQKS